jgi:hypothetical protein
MIAELKELIMVVQQSHPNISLVLGDNKAQSTKMRCLYEGIINGDYLTDNEATLKLYPDENKASNYRKLKFTLREKLINALFDLDSKSSEYNEYQRAYYDCHKLWAATKILLGKNADLPALNLGLKLFKDATHYEFTVLAMDMASVLRLQYGIKIGNQEKYTRFKASFTQLSNLYLQEGAAEQLYLDLAISHVTSKEIKDSEIVSAQSAYDQVNQLLEKFDSYRLQLYAALIHLIYFTTKQDFASSIEACKHFINYFEAKPFEANVPLQILYFQQLRNHFLLNRYQEFEQVEANCRKYMQEGTYNWFRFQELLVRMALHQGEFERAYTLYDKSTNQARFVFLPENVREIWTITAAYFYFLIATGATVQEGKKIKLKQFRINKFLNETTLYAKDKKGMNIAIVIIQYLILLAEKKHSLAIDQLEGLDQYAYRHLRSTDTARSRNFIKMMLQIPLSGFDVNDFEKKAERYRLRITDITGSEKPRKSEVEIVDYEKLWEALCAFYKKKKNIAV